MIVLLSNTPAPYTSDLLGALRRGDVPARAVFRHPPSRLGRTWSPELGAEDRVSGRAWTDLVALGALGPGTDVVLSGGWASPTDLVRRAVLGGRTLRSLHFWGERLRGRGALATRLRGYVLTHPLPDGILAVGRGAAAGYRRALDAVPGGGDRPVHVLPYVTGRGLDVPRRPAPRPVVGFAGRLLPTKGLEVVLRGLALLAPASRPHLEVVGTGPEEVHLRALARAHGLGVTWSGPLEPGPLAERRSRWWAAVVPSQHREGWGAVVTEALNSGVPVIGGAQVGAVADLVRPDREGWVVPAGAVARPAAWAEALAAHTDEDRVERTGAAARRVGAAFAPGRAAPWLAALLADAGRARAAGAALAPRSFVAEAWAALGSDPP